MKTKTKLLAAFLPMLGCILFSWHVLANPLALQGILKDSSGAGYNAVITPVSPPPTVDDTVDPPDVTPSPAGSDIPVAYSDARFSGNSVASSTTVPNGGAISKKTITDTGQVASVVFRGNGTADTIRIKSREGVRIGGSGTITIKNSFIEVNGTGNDHADGIQAYAPGSKGVINVQNSTIKCGEDQATAGFFVADNWSGDINLNGVVFDGGPFGLRIHSDKGGDINVSAKDVYFVGPFMYNPFYFLNYGGHRVVVKVWDNVRSASIVGGKLIPGDLISRPN